MRLWNRCRPGHLLSGEGVLGHLAQHAVVDRAPTILPFFTDTRDGGVQQHRVLLKFGHAHDALGSHPAASAALHGHGAEGEAGLDVAVHGGGRRGGNEARRDRAVVVCFEAGAQPGGCRQARNRERRGDAHLDPTLREKKNRRPGAWPAWEWEAQRDKSYKSTAAWSAGAGGSTASAQRSSANTPSGRPFKGKEPPWSVHPGTPQGNQIPRQDRAI